VSVASRRQVPMKMVGVGVVEPCMDAQNFFGWVLLPPTGITVHGVGGEISKPV
jgi:hypothetical protein